MSGSTRSVLRKVSSSLVVVITLFSVAQNAGASAAVRAAEGLFAESIVVDRPCQG